MTIGPQQATFHQSIRYFRPGKPVLIRNSAGEWMNNWRTKGRLVGIRPDETTGRFANQKSISNTDGTGSDGEVQRHSASGNQTFNSTSDVGHNAPHRPPPADRVTDLIVSADNISKG
jgi:hypothetical protein